MRIGDYIRAKFGRLLYASEGCYRDFSGIANPESHNTAEYANAAVSRGDKSVGWILPIVVAGYDNVTVIDFGGGAAIGLSQIVRSGLVRPRYILVETPAMCEALRGLDIEFCTKLPSKAAYPLVINAASSLQYIEDWRGLLESFSELSPNAIIISNTPVSDLPTHARCQLPRRIPAWCFNKRDLVIPGYRLGYYSEENGFRHKHVPSVQANMIFYPAAPSR